MEGRFDSGALDTLIAITGTNEAVGTRLLQVNGGDLNAAVNSFFNDLPGPRAERDDEERNDYMEEDEPAMGIPIQPDPPFGVPRLSSVWDTNTWNPRGRLEERSSALANDNFVSVVGPPRVRNVPIDFRDEEDEEDGYGSANHPIDLSNPRIEEIPSHSNNQHSPPRHQQAVVDDDIPSTASSVYRSGRLSGDRGRFVESTYLEDDVDRNFNPSAPLIAEVPVMTTDEGVAIEEEMLRAAIEASKREAAEANRGEPADFPEETMEGNTVDGRPTPRGPAEDDDLARAVTLSLKTAEEEKALRERGVTSSEPVFMEDDEDGPASDDVRNIESLRRRGVARGKAGMARSSNSNIGLISSGREKDRRSGSKSSVSNSIPIVSTPPEEVEEVEEVEEQPLLRRRTSRRSIPSTAESGIESSEAQSRAQVGIAPLQQRESPVLPSPVSVGAAEERVGANHVHDNDDSFPSDEWGGISSEEHDEAVMLEALFGGGLPERGPMGMPYPSRRGGLRGNMMDTFLGGEAGNPFDTFGRREFPQPPSPTVVAQRLIREQQDDEYLASLAADREKELRALAEAEARRQKAAEAAEAAASEERLRREEELRRRQEAENLERQLALKKESLPIEPAADEQGALTLVVRMPDGSRRGRRFLRSNKLESLFDFIDVGGEVKPGTYRLVRQYPRVAFTDGQHSSTLESLGLTSRQEVLLVELI